MVKGLKHIIDCLIFKHINTCFFILEMAQKTNTPVATTISSSSYNGKNDFFYINDFLVISVNNYIIEIFISLCSRSD